MTKLQAVGPTAPGRRIGAVLTGLAMFVAAAIGVTATTASQVNAVEPNSIDFTATCVFLGLEADQDYTLVGTVDAGPVAPGGDIHITDLTLHDLFPGEYYWIGINGIEFELGAMTPTPPNDSWNAGTPASSQPVDVTVPAPGSAGSYDVEVTSLRNALNGYDPDDPGGGITLDCTVTQGDDVLATVEVAETTTTTTSTTTTTTTSTTTTTVPDEEPVDATVIDGEAIVSEGCEVSVPVHFAEAGDYTLSAVTEDGRGIGSAEVTRDGPGDETVVVTIDGDHGTDQGDPVSFVLTDADGNIVTQVDGSVDNPEACTPDTGNGDGNGNGGPLVDNDGSGTPPAATPVSGSPTYTG